MSEPVHSNAEQNSSAEDKEVSKNVDQSSAQNQTSAPESESFPKAIVLLATYNEKENLPDLLDAIFQVAPSVDVLVVDDHSPDGTGLWVDEKMKTEKRLFCINRTGKLGLGSAVIEALRFAMDHHYDYAISMDADFSHPVKTIPVMLQMMNKAIPFQKSQRLPDVVIGSRYVKGGGVSGWPIRRRFMSRAVNLYAKITLGLKTKDNSGAFRCMRVDFLRGIDFDKIRSKGYSFFEEFLFRLKRKDAVFAETPIIFIDRVRGQSKINGKEAITALWIMFLLGVKRLLFLE